MTISDSVHDFFAAGGVPSAKFSRPGDAITGRVLTAKVEQDRDFATRVPLVWDNGDPKQIAVITVATEQRDPEIDNDDGTRRIYARGAMLAAIRAALRTSGARLEPGGTLTVTYTHDGERSERGMHPPKQYTAVYQGPPAGFSADDLPTNDDEVPF